MRRVRKPTPGSWLARALRRGPARAVALGLLLLTGCLGEGARDYDPLIGGGSAVGRPAGAARAGAARGPAPGEVPPLPPPYGSRPVAALAGDGGYELRMSDTSSAGPVPAATLQGPRPVATAGGEAPRMVPVAQPRLGFTPVPAVQAVAGVGQPVVAAGGGDTYEQLQGQLDARGVTMRRLETVGDKGEWHFICAVPHAGAPNTRRTYEARATGVHGLAAIRAVIEQIDRERR